MIKRGYKHRLHSMAALNKSAAAKRQPWVHPTWARMQTDAAIRASSQKRPINDQRK